MWLKVSIEICIHLQVLEASSFKSFDNCKHGIGFIQSLWFAKSFSGLLFSFCQPGFEPLDTSFVLCPVFDIFREGVTGCHHPFVQVNDIVLDPLQLSFVVLSVLGNLMEKRIQIVEFRLTFSNYQHDN